MAWAAPQPDLNTYGASAGQEKYNEYWKNYYYPQGAAPMGNFQFGQGIATASNPYSTVSPQGGAGGPGGAGAGGPGGAGGAGGFPTGAPTSVQGARGQIFGNIDALQSYYDRSAPWQALFGRQEAIATGQDPVNYGPYRADAYDRAASSVASDTDVARADMSNRGLRLGPGAQQGIRSSARKSLGREISNIGMQENLANRAAESQANAFLGGMVGQQFGGASQATGMAVDQLGRMQEVSGGGGTYRAGSRQPTAGSEYEEQLKALKKYFPNAMGGPGGTPAPERGAPTGAGLPGAGGGGGKDPWEGYKPGTTELPPGAKEAMDLRDQLMKQHYASLLPSSRSSRTGAPPTWGSPPTMQELGEWEDTGAQNWEGLSPEGAANRAAYLENSQAPGYVPRGGVMPTGPQDQNNWFTDMYQQQLQQQQEALSQYNTDVYGPNSGSEYAASSSSPGLPASQIPGVSQPTSTAAQNLQSGISDTGIYPGGYTAPSFSSYSNPLMDPYYDPLQSGYFPDIYSLEAPNGPIGVMSSLNPRLNRDRGEYRAGGALPSPGEWSPAHSESARSSLEAITRHVGQEGVSDFSPSPRIANRRLGQIQGGPYAQDPFSYYSGY